MTSRPGWVSFCSRFPLGFSGAVSFSPELRALGMTVVYLSEPSCCGFCWLLLSHLLSHLTLRVVGFRWRENHWCGRESLISCHPSVPRLVMAPASILRVCPGWELKQPSSSMGYDVPTHWAPTWFIFNFQWYCLPLDVVLGSFQTASIFSIMECSFTFVHISATFLKFLVTYYTQLVLILPLWIPASEVLFVQVLTWASFYKWAYMYAYVFIYTDTYVHL